MIWGERAARAAINSVDALRRVDKLPVVFVGNQDAVDAGQRIGDIEVVCPQVLPFNNRAFMAGRVKPLLFGLSPWDQTLYVDADTKFVKTPDMGFDLLEQWDFIVAETGNRSLVDQLCGPKEARETRKMFGGTRHLLYHNSGMLFWKRNDRVKRLFELWSEEWLRFQNWDEQVALLRALARSDAIFLTVPFTWNTNFPSQAQVVFHSFGQWGAQKFWRRPGRTEIDRVSAFARGGKWRPAGTPVKTSPVETKPLEHRRLS